MQALAIGLNADIKAWKKEFLFNIEIQQERKEKFFMTKADNEEAQEIPKWMLPIKTTMEFLNLEPGDGRNQSLFNYILTLQSNDFSVEESRECIRLINQVHSESSAVR